MKSLQTIDHLFQLIQTEQEEERKQYQEKVVNTPIAERRANGDTWYPVVIAKEEIGLGEQLILTIERTTAQGTSHSFQQGKTAALFVHIANNKGKPPFLSGIIRSVRRDELKLMVSVSELPDWIEEGRLGLDVLYNETTFKEMEFALKKLQRAEKKERRAELRELFLGKATPYFATMPYALYFPHLNDSQNDAIRKVVAAEDVAIIHGPPGTGKTTTLVQAITHTLKKEKQVLVCAPSNTAVDLLTAKLREQGLTVVRIGHPARVNENLVDYTLDAQVSNHRDHKQLKQMRRDAHQLKIKARKYKRHFGAEEREERRENLASARHLLNQAKDLEKYILENVLDTAQVITATMVGASRVVLRNRQFSTVFIDEAGQALAPATFIPILKGKRVVMAGDHCQLPPTVKSDEAAKGGLMKSLFERCIEKMPDASTMLDTQYRMHEQIMQFSSEQFYKGELLADESVQEQVLVAESEEISLTTPVDFIDTAGCGFEEQQNKLTLSLFNEQEGRLLLKYLSEVVAQLEQEGEALVSQVTIGVIAPYKEQVVLLREWILDYPVLQNYNHNISIHTVDGFQGQERDIIAISWVRSNEEGNIGFLRDLRRTNVAMTRAKRKLIMVGDSATLASHPFYQQLIQYVENIAAYRSAWELMY